MRIALLSQYYPPETGAAPVRLQAMTRELVKRGHEVHVITALPNYPTGRIFDGYRRRLAVTEELDGAVVRRVWVYAATGSGFGRMLGFVSFAIMASIAMLRMPRPDLVLVETPPLPATIPALFHRLVRRSPNVLLLADLWPATAVELGLVAEGSLMHRTLARLERTVYARSWRISPVTEGQVQTLICEHSVDEQRIAFLPNGVDTALFVPDAQFVADPQEDGSRRRVILFAGTMGFAQGLDTVIDAFGTARRRHPDVELVLLGGGSDRARLEELVSRQSVEGVSFIGPLPVDDVAPLMRRAYAGITSLRRSRVLAGARPSKIFPVMASGRPVIYSGDGEGADLIRRAGAGVVAPAEDPARLAEVMLELLDDPDEADAMGAQGRAFVEANLGWAALIDAWLQQLGPVPERW